MAGWILLIVIVAAFAGLGGLYHALVQLGNQARNAWAQIDGQLKRRHDLIPNLVELVKRYVERERETLEAPAVTLGAENGPEART